mgnify:CR=1 FL=1
MKYLKANINTTYAVSQTEIINFKNELKEIIDKDIDELRSALENTQGLSDYLIGRMRGSLDTLIELRKKFIKEIESVEQNGETTNK